MKANGFVFVLSGMIGVLIPSHPLFAFVFMLLLIFLLMKIKSKRLIVLCIAVLLLFTFRSYLAFTMNVSKLSGDEDSFYGKIITLPNVDGNHLTFQLRLPSNEKLQVRYYIQSREEKEALAHLKPGMVCHFSGNLQSPDGKRNPGGFDYKKFLNQQAIYWIASPNRLPFCKISSLTFFDRLKQYRQSGINKIEKHFSPESSGIAQALIFGERKGMDNQILEAYQSLGLVHVLAVSGLHVGVIVIFLFWFFIRFGLTREKAAICLLVFLPIYVVLTGAAPSVLRAALMAGAILAAYHLKEKFHPLDTISFAFLAILLFHPYFLFHVGFQLSFIISFSLIVSAKTISKYFYSNVSRLIAISVVAQLSATPILIYYFYQFSLWSLLVNVLFVPLFSSVLLPLSFLSFIVSLFSPFLAAPFIFIFEMLINFVHWSLHLVQRLPFASFTIGQPLPIYIVLYYASIFYGFIQMERQNRLTRSAYRCFIPLFVFASIQLIFPYANPYGKVTMLDVGQGDSILIELPFRKGVYLIDTGGSVFFGEEEDWQIRKNRFDVGKAIVLPALQAKGIRSIDKLILTHGDADHIGGAWALFDEVKIKQIVYGKSEKYEEEEKRLIQKAAAIGIDIAFVEEGMQWKEAGTNFYILGPKENEPSKNNRSILIYTKLGGLSWLFMGDAEEESELRVLHRYPNLNTDVLKVGHHGSKTSSQEPFINSINPKIALISVGKSNLYGHPSEEVIERLAQKNITIFRTDKNGAISYVFSNDKRYFRPTLENEK
ncbi:DNA internalization-related competence protein ComEC/Rec2 [Pueribacillus theae]|uniref:DNA internalization-related competence protein ComEC/Rec2 n=1 Tax=Pueribacillus theae TaxID=2171751 RepID=A0A2U1K6H3_9BACI|nr:DNA internalization-related competence protein ComEC/Rec2 [Pueribacillus theae]PWA12498.1 DNA internalization-related competence protein ComEC/Rec2 [Pueribacillus theae]